MEKSAQRAKMRSARKLFVSALSDETRLGVLASLVTHALPHLPPVTRFASYVPVGSEIDPAPVAHALRRLGARQLLPVVPGPDLPLRFVGWQPGEPLDPGPIGGIPEPDASLPDERPDLILVPLLAMDRRGFRLGQGAGHYDRTLARLRADAPVMAVGLGWALQRVDLVADAPWDEPLDAMLTPEGWFKPAA
jgi:5-formyltetrahydrofolate cyclo-ligase